MGNFIGLFCAIADFFWTQWEIFKVQSNQIESQILRHIDVRTRVSKMDTRKMDLGGNLEKNFTVK